jgi:hypothetical protein
MALEFYKSTPKRGQLKTRSSQCLLLEVDNLQVPPLLLLSGMTTLAGTRAWMATPRLEEILRRKKMMLKEQSLSSTVWSTL